MCSCQWTLPTSSNVYGRRRPRTAGRWSTLRSPARVGEPLCGVARSYILTNWAIYPEIALLGLGWNGGGGRLTKPVTNYELDALLTAAGYWQAQAAFARQVNLQGRQAR